MRHAVMFLIAFFLVGNAAASGCPRVVTVGSNAALRLASPRGTVDITLNFAQSDSAWNVAIRSDTIGGESLVSGTLSPDSIFRQDSVFAANAELLANISLVRRGSLLGDLIVRYVGASAAESFVMQVSMTDYTRGTIPRFSTLCIPGTAQGFDYGSWFEQLSSALGTNFLASAHPDRLENACTFGTSGCNAAIFTAPDGRPASSNPDSGRVAPDAPGSPAVAPLEEITALTTAALRSRSLNERRNALRTIHSRLRASLKALTPLSESERKAVSRALRFAKAGLKRRASAGSVRSALRSILRTSARFSS